MKKILAFLMAGAMSVTALAGCSAKNDTSSAASDGATSAAAADANKQGHDDNRYHLL